MMVEARINRMIEDASKFIKVKEICGKFISQVQEMYKELERIKKQKVVQQEVVDELQEISKVDINTLILEKVVTDLTDNQEHMFIKRINWKIIKIIKGIIEFEKLITMCEQKKVIVSDEVVTIIVDGEK